jgi:hypothetical protein
MHLIVVVVELKQGRRVVILNNKRVYVSTRQGLLEPGSAAWLRSRPPVGSMVRGCAFDCGSVKETHLRSKDS